MSLKGLLEKKRAEYQPLVPDLLKNIHQVAFQAISSPRKPFDSLRVTFPNTFNQSPFVLQKMATSQTDPLTVGVLFSGGQAAGGHNVIAGLFDGLKKLNRHCRLFGFLGGIEGVLENSHKEILLEEIDCFRNQGGFDLIGTGRGKIETVEQLEIAHKTCLSLSLDGLVIIGGDDSNTNGAILAEYLLQKGCATRVIGIPKTIDGDLRSKDIEISFGFDTACKTYSEMIGNIARDCLSAKKYYHFIKLMGRSASHICLECALAIHPNLTLIGEEKKSLAQIVEKITDLICERSKLGKDYGVILIPEGIIEFIPEMEALIGELNKMAALQKFSIEQLKEPHKTLFLNLPEKIQKQLTSDRDPHGNVKVSQIDTEQLLIEKVLLELKKRAEYKGVFTPVHHFLGYEGRSAFPSNFDANYCYSLGLSAVLAIRDQLTAVICCLQQLSGPVQDWTVKAIPVVQLIHFEMRKGKEKPVIAKYLVDINQTFFIEFSRLRKSWELEDCYQYPGPIQFFGDRSLTDSVPIILREA